MKSTSVASIEPKTLEVSIVMPCLNEAETLSVCVNKAREFLEKQNIFGEVIVADNGSTDGSQEIARGLGARVVSVSKRGYGNALQEGIRSARGTFIIMGDSDDSYDFSQLNHFVEKLRGGADLVMGNRFTGKIEKGAMPFLHRYLGNPVLSFIGRLFFKTTCGDFHCGLRGFKKSSIEALSLKTGGMEFASEMVVRASLNKLRIEEVPITLHKDGRSRPPHLRTWRDGWRHLRFLLLFSPRWLFFYPGFALLLSGSTLALILRTGAVKVGQVYFDIHTLLISAAAIPIGFQFLIFGIFTEARGIREGFLPPNKNIQFWLKHLSIERCILAGIMMIGTGIAGVIYSIFIWGNYHFGSLNPAEMLRIVIPSILSLSLGTQLIFSGFFIAFIDLE